MGKKRSQEIFGIPHDLIPPERKNHSPSTSATIGGLRQSKSPQRASKSPIDHPVTASSLLASLTGKPNPTGGDKDNPALYPYMLHPFGGYPLSFALPASYLCQPDISSSSSSKAMADALNVAAAAQANAAVGSQFFRAQQEVNNNYMIFWGSYRLKLDFLKVTLSAFLTIFGSPYFF